MCERESRGQKGGSFLQEKISALQYLCLRNISNYYAIVIPRTCARGKVIGRVVVVIVDTKIGKSGDLGKVYIAEYIP